MKRVLHIIGHLGVGGDTSVVVNVMDNAYKKGFIFDFLTHEGAVNEKVEDIRKNGCNVYVLPGDMRVLGPFSYYKNVKNTIKKSGFSYDVVHVHTSMQSGISLRVAKALGIPVRISHAHTNNIQRKTNIINKILFTPVLRYLYLNNATRLVACSKSAGEFLFKKHSYELLYNGIDLRKYEIITLSECNNLRQRLGINNEEIIIGHVANFGTMKNHRFILDIALEVYKINKNIKFVFVGTGIEFNEMKNISNSFPCNVLFLGQRNDVPQLMYIFDSIVLPSLKGEGFPVTIIEAQASGTKCIISNNVTNEVDLNINLVVQLELKKYLWIEEIISTEKNDNFTRRKLYTQAVRDKNLDKEDFSNNWIKLYE